MKVLMISGDKRIFDEGSEAHARFVLQRAHVDELDAFVWPQVHGAWQIFRAACTNRYDVITSQDPFWRGLFALKLAWLTGAKLNIQVHADLSGQSLLKHILSQIVLRHADSVRAVSQKIREQVLHIATRARVHVLPVYLDVSRFKNILPQAHSQRTILWIGRFEHEKDPLSAITVLNDVRKQGIDAKLVMLGQGSLEPVLQTMTEQVALELPGWRDPAPYLAVSDVVLSTSPHESWGASVLEALAAGVPVVAPDVGIAREAGAIVVDRAHLADAVADVLKTGKRATLKLTLPSADEWAQKWRETLV